MDEKYDLRIIIDSETYVHVRMTIDDMRERDWNLEVNRALTQAEYDNKV